MKNYKPVIDSYLRCVENDTFFDQFYEYFLKSDPGVEDRFLLVDFDKQRALIRKGLMSILTFLENDNVAGKVTIRRLHETHGANGMNIPLEYFVSWKICLLRTISEFDEEINESLMTHWEEVLDEGIALVHGRNEIYT